MHREDTVRLGRVGIWITGLLALCLIIGAATPAKAGLRTLSYTGSLSLRVSTLPGLSGTGSGLVNAFTDGGHLSTLGIPAGAFGPITASIPVTNNATINSVIFTGVGNLSGTMAGISGGPPLGLGTMGIGGVAKICLIFAPCVYANVPVPLSPVGGVGMGVGGTQIVPGAVAITMQHAGWTIGQPTMTIHTPGSTSQWWTAPGSSHSPGSTTWTWTGLPGGFAHGPASGTTSTAVNSGVIQLVTASKAFTSLTGAFPELPITGILTLHLVPEPGTLLLLGSGVAGLAMVGRRRRRR